MRVIYELPSICDQELRAVIECHYEDDSFDYEYGSIKAIHKCGHIEIDDVNIEIYTGDPAHDMGRIKRWRDATSMEGLATLIWECIDINVVEELMKAECEC